MKCAFLGRVVRSANDISGGGSGGELPVTAGPYLTGTDLTVETIFTGGAPPLKFGAGAVDEIGFEMAQFGARRVLILTDPQINALGIPARIAESLRAWSRTTGRRTIPRTSRWCRTGCRCR
jgi:hypothetical protein